MKEYNSNSITILNDIEHIQKRSGMYIGEALDGRQLLSEIFDNAMDEVALGYSPELLVSINTKTNTYTVRDWGRSIPTGMKTLDNGERKETLEILITKSNSGGKFDNSNYQYSAGLNGLGLTITNALSATMSITSIKKGKYTKVSAINGDNIEIKKGKTKEPTGTIVEFKPNPKYFKNEVIPLDFIERRCKIASALGFRARMIVDNEELNTDCTIFDLIVEDDESIVIYNDIPEIEVTNKNNEKMKVALRYTSDTKDRYFGYTNLLSNYLGGTHVQTLSKCICSTWENFVLKHRNLRPNVELKPSDYLVGLRGICAVFISNPEFSSQTKEKLVVNKNYFNELMENFSKEFTKYLEDNILVAQQLIKRFEEFRIAQNALLSRKEISSLIKVNEDSATSIRRRSVVSKLVECTSTKREDTELFIVEGDSACLRWNTMISLTDGTESTIDKICARVANGEQLYVYGKAPKEKKYLGPKQCRIRSGGITRKNALLYRVRFEDGTYVDCTGDHQFMLLDRSFKQVIDLTEDDLINYSSLRECSFGVDWYRPTRIVEKKCLNIYEDVYDIEVEEVHNFRLANGVMTHNCGPYMYVRDSKTQAVLPLRGKILNTTYKDLKEVVKNKEICDIANSIGCGIGASCDASKSRYEKVIISADADPDGLQINCLVLAVFINLFPDMVKQGRVYISLPPLYCWGKSVKDYGWCNRVEDIPKNAKDVHRFKGLGEMNNDQLDYFLVNKQTRNIMQIEYPSDIDEFNRILGTSEGKGSLLKDLGIIIK